MNCFLKIIKQYQTKVKISVSVKMIIYHIMTIESYNRQLCIKTLLTVFLYCRQFTVFDFSLSLLHDPGARSFLCNNFYVFSLPNLK